VEQSTGLDNLFVEYIAFHPTSSSIVFAGTFDGLYKSTNSGQTWTRIDSGWDQTYVVGIVFDPNDADRMYVGTHGAGVLKSTDGGQSWEQLNDGLDDLTIFGIAAHPHNSDTLFLGTESEIYRGSDSTFTWTQVHWYDRAFMAVDPQNSERVYAGGKFNSIYQSTDCGEHWIRKDEGLPSGGNPENNLMWIEIDPVDPNILYVASNSKGVYKSIDAASNWIEVNRGMPGTRNIRSLEIDPTNHLVLYAATENGVYQTDDGADKWEQMSDGLPLDTDDTVITVENVAKAHSAPHTLLAGTWGHGVFVWKTP
jgi:photosystem II stability/assembly factor-like uncharacterized protein